MPSLKMIRKMKIIREIRVIKKAIKKDCQNCMGGQKRIDCEIETCSLYPFRPWAKRILKNDSGKNNKLPSLVKNDK